MDNKEAELIADNEDALVSSKEKSATPPDEGSSRDHSSSPEAPEIEIDLETLNRFKEEFGIDLAELDLDAVQARPRLDTTVQKSRVVVVQQEAAQRRLPAKVAQQLGSVYPKQRKKILHLMSTPGSGDGVKEVDYKTQKSAPDVLDDKPKSDEDVRARLGIGRGNPLAGLAMAMKGGLRKKSPHSSPSADRKPPIVALKPTKKPEVDTSPTPPKEEAKATSTPKKDVKPSPLSTPVKLRDTPAKGETPSQASVVSDSSLLGDMSELFPRGNSRLFGEDEIDKLFGPAAAEETPQKNRDMQEKSSSAEETQQTQKNEALSSAGVKAKGVQQNSPVGGRRAVSPAGGPFLSPAHGGSGVPEWKKQLQERRTAKEKGDDTTDSKEVKEATVPEWKKELARRRRNTPEPAPVKPTKSQEPVKEATPPKEAPLKDDISSKKETVTVPAEKKVVAPKQKTPPPPEAEKKEVEPKPSTVPEWKKELERRKRNTPEPATVKPAIPQKPVKAVAPPKEVIAPKQKTPPPEAEKKVVAPKQKTPPPEAEKEVVVPKQKTPPPEAEKEVIAPKQKTPPPEAEKEVVAPKQKTPPPEAEKEVVVPKQKTPPPETEKERNAEKESEELAQSVTNEVEDVEVGKPVPPSVKESVVEPAVSPVTPKVGVTVAEGKKVTPVGSDVKPAQKETVKKQPKDEKPAKSDVPEWKQKLEERRAAREKEEKPPVPVGKEVSAKNEGEMPEWRRRILERKKGTTVSVPSKAAAVTSSEPEWKKRVEERRKQKEAEKQQAASLAKVPQQAKDKKDEEDREWEKRMRERREIREREKREREAAKKGTTQTSKGVFDAKVTEKTPEKKPMFDSSLLQDSKEKRDAEKKDKAAKEKENKAKIESLFADDDEDVLFKPKKSPPPQVEEVSDRSLTEVVESTPASVEKESPIEPTSQGTEDDSTLKDWIVVGEEEVKQADKDKEELERSLGGTALEEEAVKEKAKKTEVKKPGATERQTQTGSAAAVKKAEHVDKQDVKQSDSRMGQPSPLSLRKTPSPREQETKSPQPSSGPSWLDQAKKMREANQTKFQRSKGPASVLPKSTSENQEMPEWRKRLLEKRQQQTPSSSSSPSVGSKTSSASSAEKNKTASPSGERQEQSNSSDNLHKRTDLKGAVSKKAETSARKPPSSSKVMPNQKTSGMDEEMPDWQQRLHERKLARQAMKEKGTVSTDKPVVKTVEEPVVVKVPEEVAPVPAEAKETKKSSLFDDDGDLPDWKSKLSARKKVLEQKKDELGVAITSVAAVERSSSMSPVDKEPGLKPKLPEDPVFSSTEQLLIPDASEDRGSRGSISSEGEVFSPVCKTAPDSSDSSCKESTQASQASLISISDSASSIPRSATVSGVDSEAKEDTPPPGCVRQASLKFSPNEDPQQQAGSGVPRWKRELMNRRQKKSFEQDSGSMTGSTSSMDSKGAEDENVPPFMKEFQRKRVNSQSRSSHRK